MITAEEWAPVGYTIGILVVWVSYWLYVRYWPTGLV